MKKNFYKRKGYEGFSLIEMLITTVILGFIMLISALVLTTLIKVSVTTTNKARVRTDSEYILEYLRRTIRTTNPDYVHIYDSAERRYDYAAREGKGNVQTNGSFQEITDSTGTGNEIHFMPNGTTKWVCLAYYKGVSSDKDNKGNEKGYILKTTVDNLPDHKDCFSNDFNDSSNYMILNTRFVNIEDFRIKLQDTTEKNKVIQFDLKASAIYWYFARTGILSKSFYRQAIVKTERVMW